MTIAEANEPLKKGIVFLIKTKGLKQAFVAKRAGYKPQELSDMLNGRRVIKACDIPNLAKGLGVTVNEIYEAGREAAAE